MASHLEWARLVIAILAFRFYFHTIDYVKLHKNLIKFVQVAQTRGSLEGIQGACDIRNSKRAAAGGFGGLSSAFKDCPVSTRAVLFPNGIFC